MYSQTPFNDASAFYGKMGCRCYMLLYIVILIWSLIHELICINRWHIWHLFTFYVHYYYTTLLLTALSWNCMSQSGGPTICPTVCPKVALCYFFHSKVFVYIHLLSLGRWKRVFVQSDSKYFRPPHPETVIFSRNYIFGHPMFVTFSGLNFPPPL